MKTFLFALFLAFASAENPITAIDDAIIESCVESVEFYKNVQIKPGEFETLLGDSIKFIIAQLRDGLVTDLKDIEEFTVTYMGKVEEIFGKDVNGWVEKALTCAKKADGSAINGTISEFGTCLNGHVPKFGKQFEEIFTLSKGLTLEYCEDYKKMPKSENFQDLITKTAKSTTKMAATEDYKKFVAALMNLKKIYPEVVPCFAKGPGEKLGNEVCKQFREFVHCLYE